MTVLGFLDIGGGELLVIMIIALIVFGPQKLPEIARGIAKYTNEFKRYASDVQRQINQELAETKSAPGEGPSTTVESKPVPLEAMIKSSNPAHLSPQPQPPQPSPDAHQDSEEPPVQAKSGDFDDPK